MLESVQELSTTQSWGLATVILVAVSLTVGGTGYYFYQKQVERGDQLVAEKAELAEELRLTKSDLASSTSALAVATNQNDIFAGQIGNIASTVNTLDKLSKTDKELLQKYSKVYFLSENYVPSSLVTIPSNYLFTKDREQQIHAKTWPYLSRLLSDLSAVGAPVEIVSAYRSFGTQAELKSSYNVTYGTGANKFSADQGYSEHQLGTALDFSTSELDGSLSVKFAESRAGLWLNSNAHRYGFTLSYPKGNGYYQYEPWHWRFVGVQLATRLYGEQKHFYDLSQRVIDEYLVNIFD